jgi:hypothetical protein
MYLPVLSGATATNGVPSAATAGVAIKPAGGLNLPGNGLPDKNSEFDDAFVKAWSTAGTAGTMSATIRMWGYDANAGKWFPLGAAGTDNTKKGWLFNATALSENTASGGQISHVELMRGLSAFTRVYAEVVAIAGAANMSVALERH